MRPRPSSARVPGSGTVAEFSLTARRSRKTVCISAICRIAVCEGAQMARHTARARCFDATTREIAVLVRRKCKRQLANPLGYRPRRRRKVQNRMHSLQASTGKSTPPVASSSILKVRRSGCRVPNTSLNVVFKLLFCVKVTSVQRFPNRSRRCSATRCDQRGSAPERNRAPRTKPTTAFRISVGDAWTFAPCYSSSGPGRARTTATCMMQIPSHGLAIPTFSRAQRSRLGAGSRPPHEQCKQYRQTRATLAAK